jgi:hypothetical protein
MMDALCPWSNPMVMAYRKSLQKRMNASANAKSNHGIASFFVSSTTRVLHLGEKLQDNLNKHDKEPNVNFTFVNFR